MIRAYHQPKQIEDALALVSRGAIPVAGATGLYSGRSHRDAELVDVTALGLGALDVHADRIEIGATVTLQQLGSTSSLPGMEGALLRRCARIVASRPLRNMITVGGNIAHMVYWADLPVALLALDALVEVCTAGAPSRNVPIADCLRSGKHPWEGGLITKVIVPLREGRLAFGYERFTRTASDYSLSTVCTTVRFEGAAARDVRFAVGAVSPRPTRVAGVESSLEGSALDDAAIAKASDQLLGELTVAPNYRAPSDYRRELTLVLGRRAVATARTWASREHE